MVRIRYSELPVGLHVTAVVVGRETVVYLLPGLTTAERKSALLRVRSSARVGHGPHLPAFALARALAADRMRAAMGTLAAAMRRHPVLLVPLMALMLSVTVLVIVSGAAGATPGRLAGPLQRPSVTSPPARWQRFVRHPEPLAWRHYRLLAKRERDRHGSDSRGETRDRGGYLALRARDRSSVTGRLTAAALSHHQARHQSGGRHYSRRHRARHRWYGPVPYHVGISAAARARL
jgi:hypothetical protein